MRGITSCSVNSRKVSEQTDSMPSREYLERSVKLFQRPYSLDLLKMRGPALRSKSTMPLAVYMASVLVLVAAIPSAIIPPIEVPPIKSNIS